ncbi:MAG: hypothetical protein WDO18_23355 [Acidobacteriota bacterium]
MKKRSALTKILAIVLLALLIPSTFGTAVCWTPVCTNCPPDTYDCTWSYMTETWENFYTLLGYWYLGYSVVVCCID